MSKWPAKFPEGVPPSAAKPATEIAYRLVSCLPPSPGDFLSSIEDDPSRYFPPEELADAHGTSFYVSVQRCKKTRQRYKGLRNKRIAFGQLEPVLGYSMPSRSLDHLSVWFYDGAKPHEVICRDGDS